MQSDRLQVNASKTELLWCTKARCQHQLSRAATAIGTGFIVSSSSVRDLGIFIDADFSVRTHFQQTVAGCFAVLQQLCSIRRSVPFTVFQTLVVALVLSKLDHANATLAALPPSLLCRLLDAAARLAASLRRSVDITDTLASFHWQWAPERVKFKLAVIVYRTVHGMIPQYLSELFHCVADITSLRRLSVVYFRRPFRAFVKTCVRQTSVVRCCHPNGLEHYPTTSSAPFLSVFCHKIETFLFQNSYPDIILYVFYC